MKAKMSLTAVLLLSALSGPALATDLGGSLKDAPAVLDAGPKWTGCYLGAAAGYGMSNDKTSLNLAGTDVVTIDGLGSSGAGGGIVGGCDFKIASRILLGITAEGMWHDNEFKVSSPLLGGGAEGKFSFDNSYAVGARLGYIVTPQTLVYVKGGWTRASFGDMSATVGGVPVGSIAVGDLDGWYVGLGTEMQLGGGFGLDLSASYSRLDRKDLVLPVGIPAAIGFEPEILQARAALVYHLPIF